MTNALVPEFAVTDYGRSRKFYCDVLGFSCAYERPEEGFGYLRLGSAELMIDQIGLGRTFGGAHLPGAPPFGKGLNVQIRVAAVGPLIEALERHRITLYLPLEERWYRTGEREAGQRQFVVADPDGYLLRFCEEMGSRPAA
ncbi:VOC family protein [Aurantimonas sp. HBX-1]|uniref:bleomycin resistance protein n=1 Tax=Aurantimonas sp. HBX-1 TaxID=2906072 RepID=UPI001F2804F7|nr:VOC family protein [Aurantimonas sp. HBX-1]UIJ70598.1 VOC family protein [Aurantimonas sp. HBX-1]